MSARYELLHFIGEDSPESNAMVDAFRAEVLREMAAKVREVGTAKGWSVWAAAFMDPDVEFVDTGMPSTESIVAELRRLDRAEVLRAAANAVTALREEKRTGRPDHWTLTVADGVGEAADLLRRMAAEVGGPADPDEIQRGAVRTAVDDRFCGADLGRTQYPFTCARRVAHQGLCSGNSDPEGGESR